MQYRVPSGACAPENVRTSVACPNQDTGFIKISAAWLIEEAGFKGLREAHVGVYDLHALILVHYGGGTGKDIMHLANRIIEKVENQFNIVLVPEVNIVGTNNLRDCSK